jgi:hypothetical protein
LRRGAWARIHLTPAGAVDSGAGVATQATDVPPEFTLGEQPMERPVAPIPFSCPHPRQCAIMPERTRPRSSVDRASASGAEGTGSSPVGGTICRFASCGVSRFHAQEVFCAQGTASAPPFRLCRPGVQHLPARRTGASRFPKNNRPLLHARRAFRRVA